jgi:methionyl-tRNA formyltransferase
LPVDILYMGRKAVAAKLLEQLCARNDARIVGVLTDNHLGQSVTTEVARRHGLRVYSFTEALQAMEHGSLKFDLGVSMLYWRKLRDGFLSIPSLGTINFHPAPLPDYKGTAGYNMAILEGLDKWAVSAHYVDEEIDTGEIIEVRWFPIDPASETAQSLEQKSAREIYQIGEDIVSAILDRKTRLPTTKNEGGIYISRQRMEEMKEIKAGDDLDRKVRAFWFPPYDGAYVTIDGVKYTLVNRFLLEQLADKASTSLFTKKSQD